MYEKKIPFDIDCGIKIAMEVIGGKWKSCIILELDNGPKRPSELHRLFADANARNRPTTERARKTRGHPEKDLRGTSAPFGIFHHRHRQVADPCNQAARNLGRRLPSEDEGDPRHRGLSCLRYSDAISLRPIARTDKKHRATRTSAQPRPGIRCLYDKKHLKTKRR